MQDAHPSSSSPRPPRQTRKGLTSTGARKAASKSARSRSREFALQALYQYLVGGNDAANIDQFTRELAGFHKCDSAHYDALVHGCIEQEADLNALIAPKLDRNLSELSPIEHICLWIGTYELLHAQDVPWRVVMNEAIELAKEFGGTDGHKFVNGILDALAPALRPAETQADAAKPKAKAKAPAIAPTPDTATDASAAPSASDF